MKLVKKVGIILVASLVLLSCLTLSGCIRALDELTYGIGYAIQGPLSADIEELEKYQEKK